MNFQVRNAFESDKRAVSDVVISAFGDVHGQEIVDLITELLEDPSAQPLLSLVVTADDNVVGHILFTSAKNQAFSADGFFGYSCPFICTHRKSKSGHRRSTH